jgi:ADP-ribose pyrophosphatase YjhB (NUDIX family)
MNKKIICKDPHGNTKEFNESELSFRPSVYGVAVREGSVLLVPAWDGYDFPGGGVNLGEPLMDALVREVKEETGLDARPGRLLHMQDSFFLHPKNGKGYHSFVIYFAIDIVGGTISTAGLEEWERTIQGKAAWMPIDEAKRTRFYNPVDSPAIIEKACRLA